MSIPNLQTVNAAISTLKDFNYNGRMRKEPTVNVARIQAEINRKGLELGEIAKYSGVKYHTLYKVLTHNKPRTSAEVIAKLAVYFGCSVEYLLGMTDERAPVTLGVDILTEELVDAARPLPAYRRRDLLRIARALDDATHEPGVTPIQRLRDMVLDVFSDLDMEDEAEFLMAWLDDLDRHTDNGSSPDLTGDDATDETGEEDGDVE